MRMKSEGSIKDPSKIALEGVLTILTELEKSPEVRLYIVGITRNLTSRRSSYKGTGFTDLTLLAGDLTSEQALDLEAATWKVVAEERSKFPKAHEKMDKPHRRSVGGVSGLEHVYSVYAAWA